MLTSPRTIWPALILAARRNERVNGRTNILIVSIIIKGGLNHAGAPLGRSIAKNSLGEFKVEEITIESHRGNPNDKVKIRCEEKLKIYGIRPNKFTKIKKINKKEIIKESPFRENPFLRVIWENIKFKGDITILRWVGRETQKEEEKIMKKEKRKTQNIKGSINKMLMAGSKEEKISVIIKIWKLIHFKLWRLIV